MEPIAVTGIGCRLPGSANDPESLWHILERQVDCIGDVPPERWRHERFYDPQPGRERRTCQRQGGFIQHPERFDAPFFGISPREATSMDPQQRILLEVAWEALEDAGWPLEAVAGTPMGVFTGASVHDYADLQDLDSLMTHSVSGWALCMVSNRLSYAFDFRGPSFTVDTACSSALVALHQACISLARGECTTALVCAVNSLLHPLHHVAFSRLSMLSPTSRCHAFDVSADGYVRSEGAGVVCLKPLARALADGDRVYAVIRNTAVNSDGKNEGLTVPNVEAQTRLLQTAYAGLPIERVRYIEAHGTGTQVGDPVEARAIGTVLRHPARPVLVGSVKTNIGHLEAGAGMAGLIKACLVAWKRTIPANLHFHQGNPKIPFQELGIEIPTAARPLPAGEWLLGINSFGFGGTNGHAVLSTPPLPSPTRTNGAGPYLVCLSARSESALRTMQQRFVESPVDRAQMAFSALTRRSHLPYRMAVLSDALDQPSSLATVRHKPWVAFVFSGQGSQWIGMGRTLLHDPVFAALIDECEPWFLKSAGWSLKQALSDDAVQMDRTRFTQPLIFALQAGLTRMLRAWGIEPEVVIGHSVGEIAAAWASGALSLAHAVHLVCNRGRIMDCDVARGRMLAVSASADRVTPFLSDGVCVGAMNAPQSVVLSGSAEGVERVKQRLKHGGFDCTDVRVEYAFHSAQLDGVQAELLTALQDLRSQPQTCPMISTVTGQPVDDLSAPYWWGNVRQPVRFADAIRTARHRGIDVFVEMGGHPVLGPALLENDAKPVATLRRKQPERRAFLETLAELYRLGATLRWGEPVAPGWATLPHYPWQHESYWRESRRTEVLRTEAQQYAMLGIPERANEWTMTVSPEDPAWLADHHLHGQVLLSASTVIEMGLEAAHSRHQALPLVLEKVHIDSACFVTPGTMLQVRLQEDGHYTVAHDGKVTAGGRVVADAGHVPPPIDMPALRARFEPGWQGSLKGPFAARGLQFGPTFDAMQRGWSRPGESLAEVDGAAALSIWEGVSFSHPGTVDSCFQVLLEACDQVMMGEGTTFVPVKVGRVRLLQPFESAVTVHARLRHQTRSDITVDVSIYSRDGRLLMGIDGYHLVRALEGTAADPTEPLCYALEWIEAAPGETETRSDPMLVFTDGSAFADRLVAMLHARDIDTHVLQPGEKFDLRDHQPLGGCLHLQSLGATVSDPAAPLMPLLQLLQQADAHDLPVPRLWAVTKCAQPVGAASMQVEGAPLWGLVRVLATEEPFLLPTLIDIESDDDVDNVLEELFTRTHEEVAYRNHVRYVHRCRRLAVDGRGPALAPVADGYALTCERPGLVESLRWTSTQKAAVAADQVRIEVAAAGINFSDLMRVLGLYPTEGTLGVEMAGTVLEVGSAVADLQPGDRVMGLGASTFADQVILPRAFVVKVPDGLSDAQAAALPLAYATSYYGLLDIGRLQTGERILVHAATGGVGHAACEVARSIGAEVWGTAGSDDKRGLLRKQGLAHVFDSRSTAFSEEVVALGGVDVMLNSLAGDAIPKGLDALRRFGRFVDLTKRDIYADLPVGLNPFRRALSYTAVDLEQVMQHAPDVVQRLLVRLHDDLVAGRVKPLPIQTFSYRDAVEAFRTMSQARHVGKIVLTRATPLAVERRAAPLTPGTWLVTGGLGGFGSEVVRWLLEHGATHVAIATRSPHPHPDPRVSVHAVDVGNMAAVQTLCDSLKPLHGVVHAAMHLDDVPTLKLTRERLEKVFQAKIHGAWNLHRATQSQPIRDFILFSSNAAWFGSGGQGNYSASNAFLDSLAHARRQQGQAALVLNWGPIGDVGYLARNPQVKTWLETGGSRAIDARLALRALERIMLRDITQAGVMDSDWVKLGQAMRRAVPRFQELIGSSAGESADGPGELRRDGVQAMLLQQLAKVLGTTAEAIDPKHPIVEMGLDSLMSLQLRNWAKTTLNTTVTASALLAGPSVEELVDLMMAAPAPVAPVPEVLEHLDDAEVDELLNALLLEDGSVS